VTHFRPPSNRIVPTYDPEPEVPRIAKIVPAVVIASLVALSVGVPASAPNTPSDCPAVSAPHRSSDVAANKAMVTYFFDQLFNQHNLAYAAERVITEESNCAFLADLEHQANRAVTQLVRVLLGCGQANTPVEQR
jgi:hypothetical protein